MFNTALSDDNRNIIEGHLALRYGLTGSFDSAHSGIVTQGWSVGRGAGTDAVSTFISNAGEYKSVSSGDTPSTDNEWHHVVSVYDGGYRKIYFDGTEVDSSQNSGAVTASNRALVFGALDFNSSAGNDENASLVAAANHSGIKLDEVRFYDKGLTATEVTELYNFGKGDLGKLGGFASIPSTITATVGTALSTTVNADFTNAVYSAYNLPEGLAINTSNGVISGTPTVGGSHEITVMVEGGTSSAPKHAAANITYSANTSGPTFGAPGALNVMTTSATLAAEISQSGSTTDYDVDFFWGTSDAGATASGWDSNLTGIGAGSGQEGFYGKEVTGLTAGGTYYYRTRTTASAGPLDIAPSNLHIWLDAADTSKIEIDSTTGRAKTWQDKSGNSKHFASGGGSSWNTQVQYTQPSTGTRTQNGKNVLDFNGNQFLRSNDSFGLNSTFTLIFVTQFDSITNSNNALCSFSNSNSRGEIFYAASNTAMRGRVSRSIADNHDFTPDGQNLSLNTPHILSITYNHTGTASTSTIAAYVDGTSKGTTTPQTDTKVSANNRLVLFNYRQSQINDTNFAAGFRTYPMNGFIGEMIALDNVASNDTRMKLEKYLALKWGLDSLLPSSHDNLGTSSTSWSDAQSFTTPVTIEAPELGTQSTANLKTTSGDLQVQLLNNGNDPTTVTFFWGSSDGGTNPASWDNNVTITNAPEATLKTSLTGLTSGNTYYFRTYAKNSASDSNGDDWANTTTAFTTVTSAFREDTDAIRYSDLAGWWKFDGNLKDSSGNNRNALQGWMPGDLEIWMDASDANSFSNPSGAITYWSNKAGSSYTFNQKLGNPSRVSGGPNGHHVVKFNGTSDALWTDTSYENQNYTMFAVSRQDGGTNGRLIASRDANWLFGYHNGTHGDFYHNGWVYNSSTASDTAWHIHVSNQNNSDQANAWADFTQVATNSNGPNTTNQPKKLGFGRGYNGNNPEWSSGEVAELLLFDRVLSVTERKLVEGYLADKWSLNIPSSHEYSTWAYSQYDNAFKEDTPNGSGKSFDFSNDVYAKVSTGGTGGYF